MVFVLIFGGIIGFLVFQNVKIYQKRSELSERAQELRAQINQLTQKHEDLEQSINENQTLEYQEKILREQGLYKKPGEEVITILDVETEKVEASQQNKKVWWNPFTWFTRD